MKFFDLIEVLKLVSMSLTRGALPIFFSGEEVLEPNLQVLGYKKVAGKLERYRLLLSDGENSNSYTLLANQLNPMIHDKQLEQYTIIKVDEYTVEAVKESNCRMVIILLKVSVVKPGHQVKERIGNPQAMAGDGTCPNSEEVFGLEVNSDRAQPVLDYTHFFSPLNVMMAKKARRDQRKEKNVKQVMKAEEVAGYNGHEDIDAILMGFGENTKDTKREKKKIKKLKSEKKGQKSIKTEAEVETTFPEDKIKGVKQSKRGREENLFIGRNERERPVTDEKERCLGRKGSSPHYCADKEVQSRLEQLQIQRQESEETKNRLSEELSLERKANDKLRSKLQESEETNNHLIEDLSLESNTNDQLRTKLHESEETKNHLREEFSLERKANDELRAKLLEYEFIKYNEILGERQENNQSIISHIRGSPELKHIPQVQLALVALDEFSARLVLASEKLRSQYETMVQQSQSNKNITELHYDISLLQPPNLSTNFLNFLQSFIIMSMSQSSLHSNSVLQSPVNSDLDPASAMIDSRSSSHGVEEVVTPTSPLPTLGSHLLAQRMTGPILPHPASFSCNPVHSAMPGLPSNPTSQNSTGARPKVFETGGSATSTRKQYDRLIAQLQEYHPNLSLADANSYVMLLRQSNNGKLSGMNVQDIMKKVGCFIERDKGMLGGGSELDESCSICFEDMSATNSLCLNPCRHRFHDECINQWLESPGGAGSTCPMCRNYIVNENEFPTIGSKRRF